MTEPVTEEQVRAGAGRAQAAAAQLAPLTREGKDRALLAMADALPAARADILAANAEDVEAARADGKAEQLIDRLRLDPSRIEAMADGLRQIAGLPDPVGEVVRGYVRPNGLQISQ